jgi:hypothetical protein
MGACFDGTVIRDAKNDSEAVSMCYQAIKDSQWENGHGGYSGTLAEANGAEIDSRKTFNSSDDAWEYLEEVAEKWGPAVGVKVNLEDGNTVYVFGALCSS